MTPPPEPAVAEVFESYPPTIRAKAMVLRQLILETAAVTEGVGPIRETLKWGEPAYLTAASKSGITIRIGWKSATPDRYALYFNCQTNLVDTFRTQFADAFTFEGNRAIIFDESETVPTDALAFCIAAALTYHRTKKSARTDRAAR